ncbi:DUF4214 domain-containing protein [Cellulomonas sp. McL0617]|uniref:DUF4214 domain-containing protein n=1 Tax=Cellulomonas sp. McL0617 TaxID=3415675 RepID=UPI003CED543E
MKTRTSRITGFALGGVMVAAAALTAAPAWATDSASPEVPCDAAGSWWTEDIAPTQAADGLEFAGAHAKAVDWYHTVSGNLQGLPDTSMTITRASGYHTSLVFEINRNGTDGYATIAAEPYQNGWTPGQTGVFTVTQDTLVWTSKILSGPGSQAQPIALSAMAALFPANALISEGIHLQTNSAADQLTTVATVAGCVNDNFVAPVANVPSGSWFTEDTAPVQAADGLLFAGASAKPIDWYHPVSGNLQGVPTTTMTISRASGYHTSLVWEINRTGTSGYATIVAEPYLNGWTPGQTGVFTVTQDTKVWTSKIPNPAPGSQADPITLRDMAALYPTNTIQTEGIHLGSNSVAGQLTSVAALSGAINANFVPAPVIDPIKAYVTRVYHDLFGRNPDPQGLAAWSAALAGGTPYGKVADGITYSAEYRSGMIRDTYSKYLTRLPDSKGAADWLLAMQSGVHIEDMQGGFIASSEFYAKAGGTDAAWITLLYQTVLGRNPAPSEIATWRAQLDKGASRQAVAHGFLYSSEHLTTVVNGYYLKLLGRGIDPTGRAGWVSAIQGGSRDEQIIAGIVASLEYRSHV